MNKISDTASKCHLKKTYKKYLWKCLEYLLLHKPWDRATAKWQKSTFFYRLKQILHNEDFLFSLSVIRNFNIKIRWVSYSTTYFKFELEYKNIQQTYFYCDYETFKLENLQKELFWNYRQNLSIIFIIIPIHFLWTFINGFKVNISVLGY